MQQSETNLDLVQSEKISWQEPQSKIPHIMLTGFRDEKESIQFQRVYISK